MANNDQQLPALASAAVGLPLSRSRTVPSFDKFDSEIEDFECYIERFECHISVHELDPSKKVQFFLASIGAQTFSKLRNLALPQRPSELTFTQIVNKLKGYLNPTPLIYTERYKFQSRKQGENEKFSDFLQALRELSLYCGYEGEENLTSALKQQIIMGIKNSETQNYYLCTPNLAYEDVIRKAVADEQAASGVTQFQDLTKVGKVNTSDSFKYNQKASGSKGPKKFFRPKGNNKFQNQKTSFKGKSPQPGPSRETNSQCFRCGGKNHWANACIHSKDKCYNCGKIGHLGRVCHSKENSDKGKKTSNTNTLSTTQGYEVAEIMALNQDRGTKDPHRKILVPISIDGKHIQMEVDTGSTYSIISLQNLRRLGIQKPLRPCNILFQSYTKGQLQCRGKISVKVQYQDQSIDGDLYVVQGDYDTLLGRDWFYHIKFSWAEIKQTMSSEKIDFPILKSQVDSLVSEYSDIFKNEIGCIPGFEAKIHVKPDTKPVFCKARPIPYALRDRVDAEIDRLENLGILEKVTYSSWATPLVIVEKNSGAIRLCADYKVSLNKYIIPDEHPIPNFEEITATMGNNSIFSKFDIREAYLHVQVSGNTSQLLTINTPKGLYKVKRLFYGLSNAPAIWQRTMESLFKCIPSLQVFYDDMKISSPDEKTHRDRLRQFFEVCRQNGIRLNLPKCDILTDSVSFLGHIIHHKGIHKTNEKKRAVMEAPAPQNVEQLQSFLGLVTYYSHFIPDRVKILDPLYNLLGANTPFIWSHECQEAFLAVKAEISNDRFLVNFDPDKPLILATDASSYGIGAVLSHIVDGHERPIAFASRRLSKSEKNYSQIDKEALSIYWGVKYFFNYLYGKSFQLFTDHKPLEAIFNAHSSSPSLSATRLLHYSIFLQGFDYKIRYRASKEHGNADFCSRFPVEPGNDDIIDQPQAFQLQQIGILPVTHREIAYETAKDSSLSSLLVSVQRGEGDVTFLAEYTVEQGCLMRGARVVVPSSLQQRVLVELHEGHLGIVKMKGIARSYVYWKGIDSDIEKTAKSCSACLSNAKSPAKSAIHAWEYPGGVWQRIHIDFAGPLSGFYYLLIVDAYSKWLEVFPLKNITSATTIDCLRETFARYGLPVTLVSDNGPQLCSYEFEEFLKSNGIKHLFSSPYFPASNGQVERYVQTVKDSLNKMSTEPGTIKSKLAKFLLQYRKAPHSTTGDSPCMLMMKRTLRTRLDLITPSVKEHVQEQQRKMVENRSSKTREFQIGDKVMVQSYRPSEPKWVPGIVIRRKGEVLYDVSVNGNIQRRHIDQLQSCDQSIEVRSKPVTSSWFPRATVPPPVSSATNEGTSSSVPNSANVDTQASQPVSSPSTSVPSTPQRPAVLSTPRQGSRVRKPRIPYTPS